MSRKTPKFKERKKNHFSYILAIIALGLISVAVYTRSAELQKTYASYQQKEAALDAAIAKEQIRANEIEEYSAFTKTTKYIEELAREKLGLVYPGEIIYKHD